MGLTGVMLIIYIVKNKIKLLFYASDKVSVGSGVGDIKIKLISFFYKFLKTFLLQK